MPRPNSPGAWAATSSNGYPVDAPDSIFTENTSFGQPCEAQKVATGIDNPADAFLLAAAKDMYAVCEMMLFLINADEDVMEAMKDHVVLKEKIKTAMRKAEGAENA